MTAASFIWPFVLAAQVMGNGILIDLTFTPTEDLKDHAPSLALLRTPSLSAVEDARGGDRSMVGENRERTSAVVVRATRPPSGLATEALKACISAWAPNQTPDPGLRLQPTLLRMSVLETDRYRAEVELQFVLQGEAGETLWEGTFAGAASRFGRSLKAENYNEAISDALKQAITRLFSDSALREVLLGGNGSRTPRKERAVLPNTPVRAPISSVELKAELVKLLNVGVGEDLLLEYVRTMALQEPLTADEIIEWRNAKIPDLVVRAALSGKSEQSRARATRPSPVPTPKPPARAAKDDL